MTKKSKNIIILSLIVFLVVCLALTIYCSKFDHSNLKIIPLNRNIMEKPRKIVPNENQKDDDNDIENSKKEDKKSDSDDFDITSIDDDIDNSFNRKSIRRFDSKNNFEIANNDSVIASNRNFISVKYCVIIAFETFVLGGLITYFIINNIDINSFKEKNISHKKAN